jgi:DNA sulfur modification protein DndD
MAKITFNEISIENLGPFRERQTVDLTVHQNRPVILIKALNGSGKTTLLTALQIGLYGYKGANLPRRSEYEQLLAGLQRSDATGESAIEIRLLVDRAGAHRSVTLRRAWARRGAALAERLSITTDGVTDPEFADGWDEFINTILPAELAHLFLFDGEKIEALANPDLLPDLLRRATEVFLGLGGIDALESDLKAVERRANIRKKDDSVELNVLREDAEKFEQQKDDVTKKIVMRAQRLAELNNTFDKAKIDLDRYNVLARRSGLTAFEQAAQLKSDVEAANKHHKDARTSLAEAMSNSVAPMAWLGSFWKSYKTQWETDQVSLNSSMLSTEFKKRDQRLLKVLNLPAKTHDILKQALKDDLAQLGSVAKDKPVLAIGGNPVDVEMRLVDAVSVIEKQFLTRRKAANLSAKAEQAVGQIPAEEQLAKVFAQLQFHSQSVSSAEIQLHACTHELEELRSNLAQIDIRLNSAKEKLHTEFKEDAQELHGLEAAGRAKKALSLFRDRLLSSKAQWLSEMITAEFRGLLRKKHMISRVHVDPSSYVVSIESSAGHTLPMERLSAGERQILAVSVLSALIRERKGRFPVVVDTPLARLDNKHRSSLISNFFSKISHQVLILSTDEEVHGDAYVALQPYIATEHRLDYDEEKHRTIVINERDKKDAA